ncbi:transposon Ty3-I Gag-Pol polyprotein [Nephila pilipes]|uniref:Transposon Ty3-I Gag-Pol polyprotein n=1 Tax=Nephila pilipes TaxID=299642 RepID=A0A8X6QA10_NEPPI|nr:transposon Ty3-I Gag-Pol polyprotein [Nephila pilipes]
MRIILKDDIPVYQPALRLSFVEKQKVNKHVEVGLEQRIIRASSSKYARPVVLVKKKNGDSRLCVDYRKLNWKLVKDRLPLLFIDDVLGARCKSVYNFGFEEWIFPCRRH